MAAERGDELRRGGTAGCADGERELGPTARWNPQSLELSFGDSFEVGEVLALSADLLQVAKARDDRSVKDPRHDRAGNFVRIAPMLDGNAYGMEAVRATVDAEIVCIAQCVEEIFHGGAAFRHPRVDEGT
jgi:hypothetical protein